MRSDIEAALSADCAGGSARVVFDLALLVALSKLQSLQARLIVKAEDPRANS